MKTDIDNNLDKLFEIAKIAYTAIDEKFGKDIIVLNISKISVMADYFIIATANTKPQLKAMADEVEKKLYENDLKLKNVEGTSTSWILLDFGSIIVHLFDAENREFYNLERIWGDAEQIPNEKFM